MWPYLESSWKMRWNEYKEAYYFDPVILMILQFWYVLFTEWNMKSAWRALKFRSSQILNFNDLVLCMNDELAEVNCSQLSVKDKLVVSSFFNSIIAYTSNSLPFWPSNLRTKMKSINFVLQLCVIKCHGHPFFTKDDSNNHLV